MCGIGGLFNFDGRPVEEELLKRMNSSLRHRGPNGQGTMQFKSGGFCHSRLSIIDPSPAGRQPMCNEDETIWITYNGEFYNSGTYIPELEAAGHRFKSHSDTEVIIHLYEEYGIEETLKKMNGMFSFGLWDANSKKLFLARDRLGIKPLYYYMAPGGFCIFASELNSILHDKRVNQELDLDSLYEYLLIMSIPPPHSIYRNIKQVVPGHVLEITPDSYRERAYWSLKIEKRPGTPEEWVNEFDSVMRESVRLRLRSDVPVGFFLSGGLDSSKIGECLHELGVSNLNSYSMTFPNHPDVDEGQSARIVSDMVKSRHNEITATFDLPEVLTFFTDCFQEPFAISSAVGVSTIAAQAARDVKVILGGDGADEILGGYPSLHLPYTAPKDEHLTHPADIYLSRFSWFNTHKLDLLFSPDTLAHIDKHRLHRRLRSLYDNCPSDSVLDKKLYMDVHVRLVSEMLTKVDRATMRHGLEARVPFLDHNVVETAFAMPDEMRVSNGSGKVVLRKSLSRTLPPEITEKKKQGFLFPVHRWMKKHRQLAHELLMAAPNLKGHEFFQYAEMERVIEDSILNEKVGHRLLILMAFEHWFQSRQKRSP